MSDEESAAPDVAPIMARLANEGIGYVFNSEAAVADVRTLLREVQPTGTAATTPGEASEIRPRIASPGQRLCEYGCGYPARFHVGDNTEQYGNDSCARHLAFYVERMGGPAETDWVPVAPIDGGR